MGSPYTSLRRFFLAFSQFPVPCHNNHKHVRRRGLRFKAADYTKEYCPELADIGGIGDSYCEPYYVSDMSTIDEDPAAIVQKVDDLTKNKQIENFVDKEYADDEPPEINDNSPLAKYVIYCGERESSFGQVDYNIAGNLEISTDPGSGAIAPSPDGGITGSIADAAGDLRLGRYLSLAT